ncbi:Metallopeptidase, catalytic domain protein [Tolypocladium capitatum]|uniref:Metallopeptidase, catalytic domain protein n=1 Tax=Tolypocladium capitatum TaxID=45235 RepID=A0A2K3QKU6_9HYPO|nr:Metallopeptidase, catalytic domain protein [Tolypocladium capitatum]
MHSSCSALLSLLCLVIAGTALLAGNHVYDATLVNLNETLFLRRIGTPGSADDGKQLTLSDLFKVGTASTKGDCSGRLADVEAHLKECFLLHEAVVKAYAGYKSDVALRVLWTMFMGMSFEQDGSMMNTMVADIWKTIGERISLVTQFLNGGGLVDRNPPGPPWLFCSDDYAKYVPFDQPVRDAKGDYLPVEKDKNHNPTDYKTLGDIFINIYGPVTGFYVEQLKGYVFNEKGYKTLCGTSYGVTPKTQNPGDKPILNDEGDYIVSRPNRHVLLCPKTFEIKPPAAHTGPSLAQAVSYASYPSGDEKTDDPLDRFVPRSATLYHELYHLTDHDGTTGDPWYPLTDIMKSSTSKVSHTRQQVPNNPESFVMFAVAAYMYQNPPTTPSGEKPKGPVVFFVGGKPFPAAGFIARSKKNSS